MNIWQMGKLKEDLLSIKAGTKVVFRKSRVVHSSIGSTWWIMSKRVAVQVAETYGGKNLINLISERRTLTRLSSIDINKDFHGKIRHYEKPDSSFKLRTTQLS